MNFLFNINVCRVCMQNEQSSDLCSDKDLLEKFIFTTRLTVSQEDNLPKEICSKCIIRLKVAHSFILTAHESEKNLKAFLTKISDEFREVTQNNKSGKTTSNFHCALNSQQNLTEDEMLTLIGESEKPVKSTSPKSKHSKSEDRRCEKRKLSPLKGPLSKVSKEDSGGTTSSGDLVLRPRVTIKQPTASTSENKSRKTVSLHSTYVRDEEILFIHSPLNEIKFENDDELAALCQEEDEPNSKEEQSLESVTSNVARLRPQPMEEAENDNDAEEDVEHYQEEHVNEEEEDEEDDLDDKKTVEDETDSSIFKNNNTQDFGINNELSQSSSAELNDLNLESNDTLHTSPLAGVGDESIGIMVSEEADGYLREYETMLNNQYNTAEYIDDDSVEENPLRNDEADMYNRNEFEHNDEISLAQDNEVEEEGEDENEGQDEENATAKNPNSLDIHAKSIAKVQPNKANNKSPIRLRDLQPKLTRFYCKKCNRDFSTKTNLNRHMQSHEGKKPYVCTECSKSFSQKATLKQHMYTHTGEKPYVCDICTRGFTQCKSLIFHMRRHTGEKPFQCEYCLILFRQKDALRIHILKYHVVVEKTSTGKEIFTCIICQKKFCSKNKFKIHMKIHTTTTEQQTENQFEIHQPIFQNSKAATSTASSQRSFPHGETLDTAVMKVSASSASEPQRAKKFQCRKCFKCFALKKSLVRHMSIHYTNTEEEMTECSDCDMQFANSAEYQDHLTQCHQFACSACPEMVFKTIEYLKLHMLEHDLNHEMYITNPDIQQNKLTH